MKCIFANCTGFVVSVSLPGGVDGDVVKLFKHSDEREDLQVWKTGWSKLSGCLIGSTFLTTIRLQARTQSLR